MFASSFLVSLGVVSHNAFANTEILFQDNYTSNAGWDSVGPVTVNGLLFRGVAHFDNVAGGAGIQNRVVKQLPSALPSTRWTADFDYKFTASYIPNHRIFALTTTSDDPEAQSPANRIVVNHGYGSDNLFILVNGGVDSTPIPISPNVQYYVRLDKTPTMLTLSIFSDPARTIQIPGSPSTFTISPTAYNNNLQYIQHSGCTICGSSRTLTAQIDNTVIYTTGNPTAPIFQDNYTSNAGWDSVGPVTVNGLLFRGVAHFDNVAGGAGIQNRVVKQLPSALPSTRWTADFDYKFTASYIPNHRIFALTTTSDDPEAQSPANRIVVNHGYGSDNLFILVNGGVDSTPIPISPNVQYYVRLDKTPTMLTLSIFSDPARTIQIPGSPSTFTISPTAYNNNLQYIQHSGCTICGSSRTLTAQIDNTVIYTTGNPNTVASSIALNNVQSTSGTTSSSNQITLSGFNVGAGSNNLLLVGISANNNSPVSVTFNGIQLTQAVMSFYNNDAEFWYLKNPSGTGDVVVTMNGPTQAVVGAYSFSGVNQADPIPTQVAKYNTAPSSPDISITTKYANDLVLDLPSIYGGSTLGTPTCAQQWDVNMLNAVTGASSSTGVPSPADVTCKWTASSADFWDDIAIELRGN